MTHNRSPLEVILGPTPGLIEFGRDLDFCSHVPYCGKCAIEVASRADLLEWRAVAEDRGAVRTRQGYVLDESDVIELLAALDRQDAALAERVA